LKNGDCVLGKNKNHISEKLLAINPALLGKIKSLVAQFRPDIIQLNGGRTLKYGAALRLFENNQPWALIYRNIGDPNVWLQDWRRRLFYRAFVMKKLDGIVGVTQKTLKAVDDFYHPQVPMQYIPRAVDPSVLIPKVDRESQRKVWETPLDA